MVSHGRKKEGNVLFNDDPLLLHGLLFLISSKGSFMWIIPDRKEGNVLFNDTLNTFYLRLYGIRHMVKDHSDSERGNPLLSHGLLFQISSKGSFIWIIPDRTASTTTFVTPVVEHWLEREIPRQDSTYHSFCYTSLGALTIRKEGRTGLFNDTLNTFYLWLYGVRHMVKNHSDSERGNLLLAAGFLSHYQNGH